ncbi:MAG: ABC transporter permease [Alphaproteobacteria bacterium]
MRASLLSAVLVLPALLLVGCLFLVPIGRLAALSLEAPHLTLDAYVGLFAAADYLEILLRTLRVSAIVMAACVLLGYPLAYLMAKCRGRLRALIVFLVLLPFWTSLLVRNYAWVYLLQRRGVVNEMLLSLGVISSPLPLMFNEFGVVLGMTNALLPFMVLPIFVALQAQDKALVEAASSLGAGPSTGFLKITLPLSLSGVTAGCLIVFATALGFYVTPALLGGGRVLLAATHIAREIEETLNWPMAAAASMVLLLVVAAIIGLYRKVVGTDGLAGLGDGSA